MSTHYSKLIPYKCLNDCRQEGCPGHTLRAIHYNTSDTLAFEIDGKPEYHVDHNVFRAMMEAYKLGHD